MPQVINNPLLFCVGCLNLDLSAKLPMPLAPDMRVMTTGFCRGLGGMATNVACAAAAIGGSYMLTARLFAPCGEDTDGDWLRQQLTEKGIDTTWLDVSAATHYCLIFVQADGQRMIVSEPSRLNIDFLKNYIENTEPSHQPRMLYIDGYHASRCLADAISARRQGWLTAVDLDELDPTWLTETGFKELGQAFNLIFLNRSCASQLAKSETQADWLAMLQSFCSARDTIVLLTLGAQGAVLLGPERTAVTIPALAVKVVDTTGAGDVLAGVFLNYFSHGMSAASAARRACAAASLSTTARGALGYLPSAGVIERAVAALEA